ncbi:MAG TPA: GNAT family N-acetyltransferase [Kofleriaceae bacterium]|nr:GNAT family N-acetyltransferase [Kofleriaceae bacterium]
MSVELRTITALAGLKALAPQWDELVARSAGGASLFRSPVWLLPWWQAYQRVLAAELHVVAAFEGDRLVGLAPFYTRVGRRGPRLKLKEVRLLGDAGPRPPALDLLVEPGFEEDFGNQLAADLTATAAEWDVIDLQPLQEPSRVRAFMTNQLSTSGFTFESAEAGGARRLALTAPGMESGGVMGEETDPRIRHYAHEVQSLRKGLAALRRLSRLEWADREEASPLADQEASHFLEQITVELGTAGLARLTRVDDGDNEAIAAGLVIDDGDRAVILATAVDPERPGAAARLIEAETRAAVARGMVALDVVTGAYEVQLPELPSVRQRALRVRIYGASRSAALARTYGAVRRRVEAARDAPGAAAAGARAAWAKIRTAAETVVGFQRLHLYRGELWTRGITPAPGLTCSLFREADFDALGQAERDLLVESLDLDLEYARQKWQRADKVVLARLNEKPAGVTWCARNEVWVPELGRSLDLLTTEAYIHDVFVAPQARGRAVAPSMLEFLARELRASDVYRAWALIGGENVASVRAFEKAAYAAVADLIYQRERVGIGADKLTVRPPDPEALRLLGLGPGGEERVR